MPSTAGSDAEGHRRRDRPVRGQHLPGRAHAGAAVLEPPRPRVGSVTNPDPEPVAVRLGGASRRRDHGGAGPAGSVRGAAHGSAAEGSGVTARYDVAVIGGGPKRVGGAGDPGRGGGEGVGPGGGDERGGAGGPPPGGFG